MKLKFSNRRLLHSWNLNVTYVTYCKIAFWAFKQYSGIFIEKEEAAILLSRYFCIFNILYVIKHFFTWAKIVRIEFTSSSRNFITLEVVLHPSMTYVFAHNPYLKFNSDKITYLKFSTRKKCTADTDILRRVKCGMRALCHFSQLTAAMVGKMRVNCVSSLERFL